eukprot:scaffold18892_cov64-Phaeocystis_antarctica.AAC.8
MRRQRAMCEPMSCITSGMTKMPEGALREVAEDHVLAQREHGVRAEELLDVHARRVHLVVEGEAPLERHAALGELDHLEAHAQQRHLAVETIEEDDGVHLGQPAQQQLLRHLQVGEPRHERARVDERMEGRVRVGDLFEQRVYRPVERQRVVGDVVRGGEDMEHLGVVARRVVASAQLEGQQVGGRA